MATVGQGSIFYALKALSTFKGYQNDYKNFRRITLKYQFISLLTSFFLASAGAHAAPVFLECEIHDENNNSRTFSITLDEQTTKITHAVKGGNTFNTEGFFTASTISYQQVSITSGIRMTSIFEINRTTLAFTHTFTGEPADAQIAAQLPGFTDITVGVCELVEVTDRKI